MKLFVIASLIISTALGILTNCPYVSAYLLLIMIALFVIPILLFKALGEIKSSTNRIITSLMFYGIGFILIGLIYLFLPFLCMTSNSVINYFWLVFQLISATLAIIIGFSCTIYASIYHDDGENEEENKMNLSFKQNSLGLKHYRKGDYDKAIDAFKKAFRFFPDDSETWHNLGMAYIKNHEFYRAITAFNKAIDEEKIEDSITSNFLGYAYFKVRKYDKAIEIFKKSLEFDPYYEKAIYNLAKVYLTMELYDNAFETIEKCLEINPDSEKCNKLKNIIKMKKK